MVTLPYLHNITSRLVSWDLLKQRLTPVAAADIDVPISLYPYLCIQQSNSCIWCSHEVQCLELIEKSTLQSIFAPKISPFISFELVKQTSLSVNLCVQIFGCNRFCFSRCQQLTMFFNFVTTNIRWPQTVFNSSYDRNLKLFWSLQSISYTLLKWKVTFLVNLYVKRKTFKLGNGYS